MFSCPQQTLGRSVAEGTQALEVSSRLARVVCVFLNNNRIKMKLQIVFLSREGEAVVSGFSFSVRGAVLTAECQFHHKVGTK